MARGVLVVAPAWIGDAVLAQPLLRRLNNRFPHAVDVLANAWVTPVLERMSEVRTVLPGNFAHGALAWRARRALGQSLRARDYAQAFVLPNSWKSALVPYWAGIPQRIGFRGEWRHGLLNSIITLAESPTPRALRERYAMLADAAPLPRNEPPPYLRSRPEDQQAARAAFDLPQQEVPVIFCPGAEYGPAKRWPPDHFARLAQLLNPHPIWLLGGAKEAPLGAAIAEQHPGTMRNLCGRTTLTQAIDLIACARLVVSNDSGLMHIADALGRPLLALFGSSSRTYTPPVSPHARVLGLNLTCSPCFQRNCPLGHTRCLTDLTPEMVAAAAQRILP